MLSSKIQLALLALLPAVLAAPTVTSPTAIHDAEPSSTDSPWLLPFGLGFPKGVSLPYAEDSDQKAPETSEEGIVPFKMPSGWSKISGDSATGITERDVSAIGFQDASSESLPNDFLVTPGPGMPSLESLGLTSADLLNKTFLEKNFPLNVAGQAGSDTTPRDDTNVLEKRQFDTKKCRLNNANYGTGRGVIACKNYLQALTKQECRVPGGKDEPRVLCTATGNRQTTWVEGLSMTGGAVSTMCSNLAAPVSRIHFHCSLCLATMFDCATKGADVVDDKTRMLVTVVGSWKP